MKNEICRNWFEPEIDLLNGSIKLEKYTAFGCSAEELKMERIGKWNIMERWGLKTLKIEQDLTVLERFHWIALDQYSIVSTEELVIELSLGHESCGSCHGFA